MTEADSSPIPASLADMLPVGMLANGGIAAAAMSALANRQHDSSGWEAFHYERISATEFEITGGIAVMAGGVKKWPGPHATVIVSEADILAEMHRMQASRDLPAISDTAAPKAKPMPNVSSAGAQAVYLNVTLALPDDEAGRQRILKAFHLHADFFGARVQACSLST
jgi:hypothetical protein